jgi:hypothetical protein
MKNRAEKEAKMAVIRHLKRARLLRKDSVLLSEFTANFSGIRADLVCVDSTGLHAVEIKSFADKLSRVQDQLRGYAAYFSKTTFAVADKHIDNTLRVLPKWVGVWAISEDRVKVIRAPRKRAIRKNRLVEMLLVRDLSELVSKHRLTVSSNSRSELSEAVLQLKHLELYTYAIACIKSRYEKQSRDFFQNFNENLDPNKICDLSRFSQKRLRLAEARNSRSKIWLQWEELSNAI